MKVLIVVDMQNDFIDGSLGTKEAVGIVDRVAEVMDSFDGAVICTRDTHFADYLETSEGRKLPVEHCIEGTKGHALQDTIQKMAEKYQTSTAQFLLTFLLQLGIGVIPKASVPERMRQNLELPEFTIKEEDIWYLRGLPQMGWSGEHPDLPRVPAQQ